MCIKVVFETLRYNGSVLMYLLNLLCFGLMANNIEIYDSFSAVTVSLINDQYQVDPDNEQMNQQLYTMCWSANNKKILCFDISKVNKDVNFSSVINLLISACVAINAKII